jgi:hypothetical protein
MRITKFRSKFILGHGTEIEIEGVAAPTLFTKRGNFFAEKGDSLLSLVTKIADANGLIADVEDGTINKQVRSNGKNGFQWLKNVVQHAIDGNKGYQVWIRNTGLGKPELVVRTQTADSSTRTWNFLYGVDKDGEVLEYDTEIQANLMFGLGAGGVRTVFVDPGTKETKEIYTNSRNTTGLAGEGRFIPEDSTTPPPLRIGYQNEESAIAFSAAYYARFSHINVTSRLRIHGNPLINPADKVAITVLRGAQTTRTIRDIHPTSGTYGIKSVTHSISDGNYITDLELFRRGNLTEGSGGSERTTGSEAATNQAKKVSDITTATTEDASRAKRLKYISKIEDPELRAKFLEQLGER